jgi:hypothetical protein
LNQVWDAMNAVNGVNLGSELTGAQPRRWGDSLRPGFVVHIDAPWGGGKTSFADFLSRILNPYRHAGPLPPWMKELHLDDSAYCPEAYRRPWHVVNFNAWRHQHVKPPWWVFAESIRNHCVTAIRYETNQQIKTLPPPNPQFAYPSRFNRWLFGIRCRAAEQFWRIWTPDFRTRFWIALASLLLLGVLFRSGLIALGSKGEAVAGQGIWVAPLVLLLGGAPAVWTFLTALTQTLLPGTPEAAQNYALGAGDPLDRFRKHFASTIRRYRRPVLVIVDDLDRCDPEYVTELIRGMQTILVSQRIVFLLLGDRDWVEQAFSETYKTMKGIYVGPEHEFGARFVEKAIQFSFVLPDVSRLKRRSYVRKLLNLREESFAKLADHATEDQKPLKKEAEVVLAKQDYATREAAAAELRNSLQGLDSSARGEILRDLDIKLSLRAAADSSAESATSHMIEALAPLLPSNPRQIKRIVNALSLMQEAARLQGVARPGSPEWQVLARWIVIMTEWPKTSYTLSRYPGIADKVLGLATQEELPDEGGENFVEAIKSNRPVVDLMTFSDPEKGWQKRDINASEVSWLRVLIPPASGRFLDIGSSNPNKPSGI